MDLAIALVQSYLQVNGYFTVTEYPVLELLKGRGYSTVTDIDVIAMRPPHAGGIVPARPPDGLPEFHPDPELHAREDGADLIIAEVKEGHAELNRGSRDPAVLSAVLARFGLARRDELARAVQHLLGRGESRLVSGARVRLVAFGSEVGGETHGYYRIISLAHVIEYLRTHIREHWEMLRHTHSKDVAFGFLMLMEKAERGRNAHAQLQQYHVGPPPVRVPHR